jgi:tRNA(adenine34) deaminase
MFIGLCAIIIFVVLILFVSYVVFISHSTLGISSDDKKFMDLAYALANSSYEHGDIPVGAVLVVNGKIISSSEATSRRLEDHRNHAEMLVINDALNKLHVSDFSKIENVTLYTTFEPCSMCEGFIVYTKVPRVVVGARKSYIQNILPAYIAHLNYRLNERGGIYEDVQRVLLTNYMNSNSK